MPKRKGTKKKAAGNPKPQKQKSAFVDDEEIDEDMAFDAQDEEKYGHLFQGHDGGGGEEDDEDQEEDEDGAQKLLSDMLEDEPAPTSEKRPDKKLKKGPQQAKPQPNNKRKQQQQQQPAEEEENEDEDEDGEEEEEDEEDLEVEYSNEEGEDDGTAHEALLKAMGSLDSSKQTAAIKRANRTRAPTARGQELLEETEFAASWGEAEGEAGLSMQDLMNSLAQVKTADLKKLKTRLVKLGSEKKAKPVDVPLEEVHQHAAERKVTYESVKEAVKRWVPVITKNRMAKTLQFPLNEPARAESISSSSLQSQFTPSNDLEQDLQNILEQYGYTEKAMRKRETEQLELRELSPEEARERQQHLAQLKSLLFFHEIKQKRLKKIKSKLYHKLKKKREEGKQLSAHEAAQLDSEEARELQMAQHIDRIKERMTQRHKNTSKWAKKQLQLMKNQRLTPALQESRSAIEQQLNAHQKLLRKPEEEDQGQNSSSEDEEDEDEDPAASQARFKARVAELNSAQAPDTTKLKGLAGLKFMQKAREKRQAETDQLFEDALKEGDEEGEEAGEEGHAQAQKKPTPAELQGVGTARRRFDAASASSALSSALRNDNDDGSIDMLSTGFQSSKVGFSKGFAVGTDRFVDVSGVHAHPSSSSSSSSSSSLPSHATTTTATQEKLFEVEEFSDTEADVKPKVIEFKTPAHLSSQPSQPKQKAPSSSSSRVSLAPSMAEEEDEDDDEDDEDDEGEQSNPWQTNNRTKQQTEQKSKTKPVESKTPTASQPTPKTKPAPPPAASSVASSGPRVTFAEMNFDTDDDDDDDDEDDQSTLEKKIESKTPHVRAPPRTRSSTRAPPPSSASSKIVDEDEDDDDDDDMPTISSNNSSNNNSNPAGQTRSGRAVKAPVAKLDSSDLKLLSGNTEGKFNLLNNSSSSSSSSSSASSDPSSSSSSSVRQEKLVREAFSITGEAEQLFAREKQELVSQDLPKFEDTTLPGWGRWGGDCMKPRPFSQMKLKVKAAIEKKAAQELAQRQDAKLEHVIISQKVDKKSLKYMVAQLPYPFTSVEQFDKAQRTPLGSEWNPISTFQESIKPAVLTRPGEVIQPITLKQASKSKDKSKKKDKYKKDKGNKTKTLR